MLDGEVCHGEGNLRFFGRIFEILLSEERGAYECIASVVIGSRLRDASTLPRGVADAGLFSQPGCVI
jgi:hypothetical protein